MNYISQFALLCVACGLLACAPDDLAQSKVATKRAQEYAQVLRDIEQQKARLGSAFQAAKGKDRKRAVVNKSRQLLESIIMQKLFGYWYGTQWDYNGTTEIPRQGKIACGYFVTTVLQHSGFKLNRYRLAQLPSESMITQLIEAKHVRRYRAVSLQQFLHHVRSWGEGVYLVGLDKHTGFLVNRKNQISFIHSSYFPPFTVVREVAEQSYILRSSKYRVLGKLFEANNVQHWLTGGRFKP